MDEHDFELQVPLAPASPDLSVDSNVLMEPVATLETPAAITLSAEASILDAIELMKERQIGAVMVTDGEGRLVGIFTERDLVRRVVGRVDKAQTPIAEVMTRDPECLLPGDTVAHAMNFMHLGGYRHVPVIDADGRPVSIVSVKDVNAYLCDFFAEIICNLPPPEARRSVSRYGG